MSGKNVLFHAQASRDPGTALRFSSDKGATFWAYIKHADLQHQSHGQRGLEVMSRQQARREFKVCYLTAGVSEDFVTYSFV